MSYERYSLGWKGVAPPPPPGGTRIQKRWGRSSRILKLTPKGDQSGRDLRIFLLLKETNLGVAPAFFDPLKVNETSFNSKRDLEG